jgi:3-hydroxyisobutyrate dehydrogenase-like beta-hydroxyacid dehydrogenase
MRIGVVGLGNTGGPMALNVLKAGHTMVVTDIRHEMAKPLSRRGCGVGRRTRRRGPGDALSAILIVFGGPDLVTLLLTARTPVCAMRVKAPGQPHAWYRRRSVS